LILYFGFGCFIFWFEKKEQNIYVELFLSFSNYLIITILEEYIFSFVAEKRLRKQGKKEPSPFFYRFINLDIF